MIQLHYPVQLNCSHQAMDHSNTQPTWVPWEPLSHVSPWWPEWQVSLGLSVFNTHMVMWLLTSSPLPIDKPLAQAIGNEWHGRSNLVELVGLLTTMESQSCVPATFLIFTGFPGGSVVKNLPEIQKTSVRSLDQENPLEEGMVTHASILAWKIPRTEEPGGLQSMELQRVGHDWSDWAGSQGNKELKTGETVGAQ